jgi:hypothetical protein
VCPKRLLDIIQIESHFQITNNNNNNNNESVAYMIRVPELLSRALL